MKVLILWSLLVVASNCLDSAEKRRYLLLKCGHLTTNDTLIHCFEGEMQKIELRELIEKSMGVGKMISSIAMVDQLVSTKIGYVSLWTRSIKIRDPTHIFRAASEGHVRVNILIKHQTP